MGKREVKLRESTKDGAKLLPRSFPLCDQPWACKHALVKAESTRVRHVETTLISFLEVRSIGPALPCGKWRATLRPLADADNNRAHFNFSACR